MDPKESQGAVFSDDETDSNVQNQDPTMLPPRTVTAKGGEGYKFTVDQNLEAGFNFGSGSQSNFVGSEVNGNSSSDVDEDDGFEHINASEDTNGTDSNSVPSTPTKLTPHKRTAHLASTSSATAGVNGSPPSSPVPKKRKAWDEYVREDEEKENKKKKGCQEDSKEKVVHTNSTKLLFLGGVVFGIVAVLTWLCIYGACPWFDSYGKNVAKEPPYTWKKAHSNFFNWTRDLQVEFPNQKRETWIALIASVSSNLKKTEPVHPAAITVLFPPSLDQDFVNCFLRKFGKVINKAVAPLLGADIKSPSDIKILDPSTFASAAGITKVRSDIKDYLENRGKAVITLDIDKFNSEDSLLQFHGFCDNFHAVDKRATFLFPVRVPENVFNKFEWIHERGGDISNTILTHAWKQILSADTGPALVARVTDTVILLNEGDTCTL